MDWGVSAQMNPNLDILRRVEAAIEFEKKRHRLNLNILTKVAEMMKSMTDAGGLSDVAVEVLAGQVEAQVAEAAEAAVTAKQAASRKPGATAKAGPRRSIVNMDGVAKSGAKRSAGLTAAIREAITYFGNEAFKTGEILEHVRQHHPEIEVDSGTISKRLYQLRNSEFIELVPGGKPGKHGSQPYRLKST